MHCDSTAVLNAWLKSRSPREVSIFQDLFDRSFQTLYTWETQNLQLKMDVLQCNIVQQMLVILEGLVPKSKAEDQEAAASVHESVEGRLEWFLKVIAQIILPLINMLLPETKYVIFRRGR